MTTADSKVFVDALLVSSTHGLIAFDLTSKLDTHPADDQLADLADKQNQIHASLFNKLNAHRELRKGRQLGVTISVITCHPSLAEVIHADDLVACPPSELTTIIEELDEIDEAYLRPLNAAVQRVSTLRPPRRRENVKREDSRGAILKKIEREIANLDQWQNRGAIEYANGPQRIRGLAGSGKTVVLALKAAYLAARHPEWKIAVSFQSRALYQQFRDLIRRFMFDQIEDEPDWSNLQVLHGWGSAREAGLYSTVCAAYDVSPVDWRSADAKYGSRAYEGICDELNVKIAEQGPKHLFDAILIDEAQDFPIPFFRMIYNIVPAPHRIMWAYDDLQNLGDYEMPSEHELFGSDAKGRPLVSLRNVADKPKEDIVLPVCYRNTPWTLATAHALGFGLYRPAGLVQMFEEPSIWPRIGYELTAGHLELGAPIGLRRSRASYPSYFEELLHPEDAIQCEVFEDSVDQYEKLAESIKTNLYEDELEHTDILIVLPSAYTSKRHGAAIMRALAKRKIISHLAGVNTSRDQVFSPGSVAITHIFRAKGNEAPMVYIVNAEFCQIGFELSRKRNILFTGITRSRCWVRLFGVGSQMEALKEEVETARANNFELRFTYPTAEELKQLARVHRDMSEDERKDWQRKILAAGDVFQAVMDGELPMEALPVDIQGKLLELSKKKQKRR